MSFTNFPKIPKDRVSVIRDPEGRNSIRNGPLAAARAGTNPAPTSHFELGTGALSAEAEQWRRAKLISTHLFPQAATVRGSATGPGILFSLLHLMRRDPGGDPWGNPQGEPMPRCHPGTSRAASLLASRSTCW